MPCKLQVQNSYKNKLKQQQIQNSLLYSSEKPSFLPMECPEKDAAIEFEAAEKLILRWDEARECIIFDGHHRQEADRYLHAVDEIVQRYSVESVVTISTNDHPIPSKINSFEMQMATTRLQHEFHKILITHMNSIETDIDLNPYSNPTMSCVTESSGDFKTARSQFIEEGYLEDEVSGSFPLEAIYDLRSISERMISAGYLHECIQVYVSVRKPIFNASFNRLGIDKLSIGDVQILEWEALKKKIGQWIEAAKVCVWILFAREKWLCDQIFEGDGLGIVANDTCFMKIIEAYKIQLFDFPEAIFITWQSPKKLFKLLDLYEAVSDLSKMDVLVKWKLESVRANAVDILLRLGEVARGILSEFENTLQSESTEVPVFEGKVHTLTWYVMSYIFILISDYKQTMTELIVSNPSMGSLLSGDQTAPYIDFHEPENQSPLALHLLLIIQILEFKLEDMCKYYKDASLSHIFLMNNLHYIVQKVKSSPELCEMIGDDYIIRNLTLKFRQEAMNYERSTWAKILYCLRNEEQHVGGSSSFWVSKSSLKERFKTFNSMFEEVHQVQATWTIPDPQLREELRISLSEKLIPAYRSFLGRFKGHIESRNHPKKYVKYSVDDLEIAVRDFFEWRPISIHTRKRSIKKFSLGWMLAFRSSRIEFCKFKTIK